MKVRLLFFAVLRDIVGTDHQELEVPDGSRAVDLWSSLRDRHPELRHYARPPMTAVNEEYMPAETRLEEGDEVAFIPPVSGGH